MICGLDRPSQGTIHINDIDVYHDRRAALNTVGMIFQNPDHQIIFPTVIEEMIFGLTQMGVDKPVADQRAMSYLAQFGKSDWRDRAISTLSQGQKKLLCLMAILAMGPKVIILDEPLAALDIPTQRQLTTILQSLPQTLIYITHDTAPIQNYDVAIWLEQGQIVETGSPDKVVPRFIDEMNRIEVL
ncbi:MAG: ABC transporter ATP-binding protein [Rhodobacteraceae bacterium]|nr:ABC transporter ATP-binding protein [Paracoccaceae bacterium]